MCHKSLILATNQTFSSDVGSRKCGSQSLTLGDSASCSQGQLQCSLDDFLLEENDAGEALLVTIVSKCCSRSYGNTAALEVDHDRSSIGISLEEPAGGFEEHH